MLKLLPILMLLMGTAAGIGAGIFLQDDLARPPEAGNPPENEAKNKAAEIVKSEEEMAEPVLPPEYIALNNQFVVPVVDGNMVASLVVLSLGVEVRPGNAERIYTSEPKLRDVFLQVLFDHANMGGFQGRFTDGNNMDVLRRSLTEAAQSILGPVARGVMITDIARQDV